MHNAHSLPLSGHLGLQRCYKKIKNKHFWPHMLRDLTYFIKRCPQCQESKTQSKSIGLMRQIPTIEPFHIVNTDVCGPLPTTQNGNKYIITAICVFSKWVETKATEDQTGVFSSFFGRKSFLSTWSS